VGSSQSKFFIDRLLSHHLWVFALHLQAATDKSSLTGNSRRYNVKYTCDFPLSMKPSSVKVRGNNENHFQGNFKEI
jgi:hypothetical protein